MRKKKSLLMMMMFSLLALAAVPAAASTKVFRYKLKNGMHVVLLPNPLAPVVSVFENYRVGANETPSGFPGMAHAQEHMMFRGCQAMSADQTAAILAQMGGDDDADTQQNMTQYYATVPASDLAVALHVDASCMGSVDDSQQQWSLERGAIEQEVASDLSNPSYRMLIRMNRDLFAGSPYEHDALGTKKSFDATTGAMLHSFYSNWYAPNNATLVVAGDFNPATAIATVRKLYGKIPRHSLAARPAIALHPVHAESFTFPSDYPYIITALAFRMPGSDSPDYAATRVLADVLASQRGTIYGLVPAGKALDAGFQMAESYRKASMGLAYVVIPSTGNASAADATLRKTLADAVAHGISADLVASAKRLEIADAAFDRNSIPGMASLWSQALVAEGRNSPQQDVDAIRKVTLAEVRRVARKYLLGSSAVSGSLVPEASGKPSAASGFGGSEKVASAPSKAVELPSWAKAELSKLTVPHWNLHPSDVTLHNGIRLIVQTEKASPTVTLVGEIRQQPDLETAAGQEGVDSVLDGLFSYGSTSLDRVAFQAALDKIGATESAGAGFSLRVLRKYMDRGVELLAENELHPALPQKAFRVVQRQTAQSVAGLLKSPGYRARRASLTKLLPEKDPALRQSTPKSVDSLTLSDVSRYYHKAFRPDLATIVVVGDVTPRQARKTVEKYFGGWKAAGAKPQVDLPAVPANHAAAKQVPDPTRIQDRVTLSEELPMNRFNPDYYALEVGNHVLGGGFYATRLYRDMREKTGYVYFVGNGLHAGRTRTTFSIDYGCNAENVSKAKALAIRDLKQMQSENVTPDELQLAKAMLLRRLPLAEDDEQGVAGGLLGRAVMGLPLNEPLLAARRYDAITAKEVRVAFARWLRPKDFVQVVLGPKPH